MEKEMRKKSHKKEKKRKKRKSSSSHREEEWVEKDRSGESTGKSLQEENSDWGSIFSGQSTADIRKSREVEKSRLKLAAQVKPGQTSRELNPYWKDGGSGLPPEQPILDSTSRLTTFRRSTDGNVRPENRRAETNDVRSIRGQQAERDLKNRGRFRRPVDDDVRGNSQWDSSSFKSSRGWRKGEPLSAKIERTLPVNDNRSSEDVDESHHVESTEVPRESVNELSALNAKIMRAELIGKTELVTELKVQLEAYRRREEANRTVLLTETDSRGFTRPVKRREPQVGSSKTNRRVPTHENNKRVRYFADDDDHSLQDMFEREKNSSSHDQDAAFVDLIGKELARKDGSLALDDPFEETASIDDRGRRETQRYARAVRDQAKKERIYDECKWCLGAKRMNQRLVVASKQSVYLSVPHFQALTRGHCLIVPNGHVSCSTQVDEDVWAEVADLRKELVSRFANNDEDVLFFETASHLHKHPHMILHCVPIPREIGDVAPVYFKKALLECETEWTNNRKVVELAGRGGVRKAVPKGLPYFFVDFGNQDGYAHVIEDQQLFPNNFAQEIVGGMLDLHHGLWRKQRNASQQELNASSEYLKKLLGHR